MDLGYSISSYFSPETSASDAAAAVLENARVAREAGYDYVETGDHHAVSDGGYLQNVPMAARLTGEVDRVAPLFLLPVWDPVIVAEQVGTVGALAEVDFWCAVGRAEQVEAMGVPAAERGRRIEEALDLLERLWTGERVTFDGEFYAVEDAGVSPAVDPRICIGGSAEPAVRRAGRRGDAWVVNAHVPVGEFDERIGWFEDAGGGEVIVRRDALALSDGATATDLAGELLADGYRGWSPGPDRVLAGDADRVAAKLAELRDMGVDEVVVRPMHGDHAAETLRETARARDRL